MKRVRVVGVASLFLLSTSTAVAGTPDGRFAVERSGRVTCSQLTTARKAKSPAYSQMMGFVDGYLTAANRYEPNTFDLAPWQSTATFSVILQSHCAKNPNDNLASAVQKLVIALKPLRLTQHSNMVDVKDGSANLSIYESVLRQAQDALTKKGLYKGAANGRFSPELKLALQNFQRSNKLTPSGVPDSATLWVLLNP